MSHSLGFFAPKLGVTVVEVRAAYHACRKGLPIDWPAGDELSQFIQALENRYPQAINGEASNEGSSPWAASALRSKGCFIVDMGVHAADEVGGYIWELLQHHYLVVYDPQADRAYVGIDELADTYGGKKWWQFWS